MGVDEQIQAVAEVLAHEMLEDEKFQKVIAEADDEHERMSLIAAYVLFRQRES